jgi:hypothetical protein
MQALEEAALVFQLKILCAPTPAELMLESLLPSLDQSLFRVQAERFRDWSASALAFLAAHHCSPSERTSGSIATNPESRLLEGASLICNWGSCAYCD